MKEDDFISYSGGRLNHPDDLKKYFSQKTFKDFLLEKDSPLVYTTVTMDGKDFLGKSNFEVQLHQKTADHDEFIIIVPDDALDTFEGLVLENSRKNIGKNLTINFHRFGEIKQTFEGIITRITNKKKDGYGELHIMGNAPTILMEHGLECQSFENKSLSQIISEATKEYPLGLIIDTDHLNSYNKESIPYTVQYKETDYQFIQRLAKRHGEFFYYNGQKLILGNKTEKRVLLEDGRDLINIEIELNIKPQNFQYKTYDGFSGSVVQNDSQNVQDLFSKNNPFQDTSYNASQNIFKKKATAFHSQTSLDQTSGDLRTAILKEKESRQNLVVVRGSSRDPEIRQGCLIELKDINGRPMETYRIIEIKHFHDGGNQYHNEFTAMNDAIVPPYYDENAFPLCEQQYARVIDNNDPSGIGRVRVRFAWQEDKNLVTPWIRLIQPHSGGGKGFYFIPEIGEEVLVGFESDNAETPFVLGTQYNGGETSGFHHAENDFKAIKTRSGHHLTFEELKNITLADAKGNKFHIDSDGSNINITALETLNIKCKNFNIDVEENMKTQVGKNITTNAGKDIKTTAKDEISQDSGKKMIISSGDNTEISARKDLDLYGKKKLIGFTDGKTEFGAKEQMHLYGASSLITAKDKIEYKAPSMNKLPESGKFEYDKEPKIIDAIWLNSNAEEKIKKLYKDEEASILVMTRNAKDGEQVSIEVEEINEVGEQIINTYSGEVDGEGRALLKQIVKHN